MDTKRDDKGRRRAARRRRFSIESLERRALLTTATETFVGPSLSGLIAQAEKGKNTTPAQINKMVDALQSQLESGPLADLITDAVTSDGFITEAQALETSYEQNVDQQLSPKFPNNDELLKLQGQRVVANLIALNQQNAVGMISDATLDASSRATIVSLSAGPIFALGTKPSTITAASKALKTDLFILEDGLDNSSLTLQQVITTLGSDAEAYRTDIHAGIQMTQLRISGEADTAINALESSTVASVLDASSNPELLLSAAITKFDAAILNTSGLFAAKGALSKSKPSTLHAGTTNGQAVSKFTSVSATSTSSGIATLTATLTSSDGSPLMGESVGFTLDGAFAGIGVTNFHGVATLTGVAITEVPGTSTGSVVAYFASDTNFLSTTGSGTLAVSQVSTTVSNVSGTATFGGPASLSATLDSTSTGQGLAGQTVSFSLDGVVVGTALTNSNGVATLTGAANTAAVGTNVGAIVASFAGGSVYASSASTGNLVVGEASTTLSNVSATAAFGGTATLTATLDSSTTNQGAVGETVDFTLNGTSVGSAVTGSGGVATLTGVATTASVGTVSGAVVASFGGDTSYFAAPNATGDLVVSQAGTSLGNVAGTATFGGTATLSATLTSTATSLPIANETVNFTLGGTVVGSALTNSSGLATFTGAATTAGVGTDASAVVATFAGDTNYSSTTTTGDLVVSPITTALGSVSGTATFGGPATLMATLTNSATSLPIAGQTVSFTLDGTSAGTGVTNSSGVATVTGVAETDSAGTGASVVVASFAGSTDYAAAATTTGNLVVSLAATALGSVAGTAPVGGPATLSATLTSSVTGLGLSSETVHFTLGGNLVGSAQTNSSGVATLTDVTTSAAVGTDAGAVVASFMGDPNYAAATNATGDLVVSKVPTALAGVAGTATFGGTATLTATLTSTTTSLPLAGETVSFTLAGTSVGTAVTNSSGVATLAGVATTAGGGTDVGSVVASFAGDATHAAAADATGPLVVGQATTQGTTSGTATFGGTATLTATLTSSTTSLPIVGATVNFTLDNTVVGTAVTNSSGVATLTGAATTDSVGTHPGAILATFAGDVDYTAFSGSGILVVSQAGTSMNNVGGTATFGGTATLSATLISSVTNLPIAGETVSFALGGTTVGSALTNSSGVATLTGVVTTAGAGTDTGAVVAGFAGDVSYTGNSATGDLVVSQATTQGVLTGMAFFGGTATLTTTLTTSGTNLPIVGETVTFTLDSSVVGTAVTNSSGVATLTGVATTDPVGTHTGAVFATFAGDTNYTAFSGNGDLVVSQAPTVLSSVSGTTTFGGPVPYTLTATLTSPITGLGIAGETVFFTLNSAVVGQAVTNGSGVATFTSTTTSTTVGTDTGGVTVIFDGDASYLSSSGTGDFVVNQAPTTLASVSGTSPVGGPATLIATLTSTLTGLGVADEVIDFTLDGLLVGSAVTDSNGIATLTGVATSDPAGTDSGGVVANFAGDTDYVTSQGVGDLTVS